MGRQATHRRRTGISLVETAGAVLITGVCVAATTSALYVVSTASGKSVARTEQTNSSGLILQRLRDELSMAASISELTASRVTFTHPDFTGDAVDEKIAYSWGGAAGDPIIRTLNGTSQNALENCTGLSMEAALISPELEMTDAKTTSTTLAYHDTYLITYQSRVVNVSTTNWYGELFAPTYSGAQSCTITSVWLRARRATGGTPSGNFKVSIQETTSGTDNPSGVILQEVVVAATSLPVAWSWVEFPFSSVKIANGQRVAVVAKGTAAYSGEVNYNDTVSIDVLDGDQLLRYTTNSGTNWYPINFKRTKDLRFYAYGYFTLSDPAPTGKYASGTVGSIHVHAERRVDAETLVSDTAVNCVNRPMIGGMTVADIPVH
ncbi:MAG: hypothetical protein IT449_08360 [Phycisphaerales bacterium]|nr:hypothetical protein [Phycisphaerales bacterium]